MMMAYDEIADRSSIVSSRSNEHIHVSNMYMYAYTTSRDNIMYIHIPMHSNVIITIYTYLCI